MFKRHPVPVKRKHESFHVKFWLFVSPKNEPCHILSSNQTQFNSLSSKPKKSDKLSKLKKMKKVEQSKSQSKFCYRRFSFVRQWQDLQCSTPCWLSQSLISWHENTIILIVSSLTGTTKDMKQFQRERQLLQTLPRNIIPALLRSLSRHESPFLSCHVKACRLWLTFSLVWWQLFIEKCQSFLLT